MEKINISKKYNLPSEVRFCKGCVISNQRPRIVFDEEGICGMIVESDGRFLNSSSQDLPASADNCPL